VINLASSGRFRVAQDRRDRDRSERARPVIGDVQRLAVAAERSASGWPSSWTAAINELLTVSSTATREDARSVMHARVPSALNCIRRGIRPAGMISAILVAKSTATSDCMPTT
jgi:hypothetical protein